jgi:hypothetical protein
MYAICMQVRIYLHITFNNPDLNIISTNVFPNRTAWRIKSIYAKNKPHRYEDYVTALLRHTTNDTYVV